MITPCILMQLHSLWLVLVTYFHACFLFPFLFRIRERDTDKDGKVNFNEFFHGLFDLVRNYEEEGHNASHHSTDAMEAPAKKLFSELDKNGDGYILWSFLHVRTISLFKN